MQHNYVIVDTLPCGAKNENYTIGTLGVLNGMMTSMGLPRIAMIWKDAENGSKEFVGFCKYPIEDVLKELDNAL